MHKLNGSNIVPDLDTSDKDTSGNSYSNHGEDIVESDDKLEGVVTLGVTETDNGSGDLEVQDLEYSDE